MPDPDPTFPTTISKEQRHWAMLAHLSGLLAFISIIGGIVAPFILWQLRKRDMNFAADQAREALNFQITVLLIGIVCFVLKIILIGFALMFVLAILDIIFIVIASTRASEGIAYRYPFNLRLVS